MDINSTFQTLHIIAQNLVVDFLLGKNVNIPILLYMPLVADVRLLVERSYFPCHDFKSVVTGQKSNKPKNITYPTKRGKDEKPQIE